MKKAIVMAGVLFALTMTAGCGSQNQDHVATAESQTQDTAGGSGTAAQSENTDQKQTDGDRTDTAEADVIEEALQDNENTEKSSKVLVAYYSATGNTKAAAETIADAAGGELFELQPAEAYTTEDLDYNDPESRVCKEHEDPDLQDVKLEEVTPESFPNADVVFLGYPIWWGEAAWPVNEFVKENDFTPVVNGVTKIETLSFKHYNDGEGNTFDKVLINPYKGVLAGDLVPEFKVTKDVRHNKVQVYGTITICGGFLNDGAIKVWK